MSDMCEGLRRGVGRLRSASRSFTWLAVSGVALAALWLFLAIEAATQGVWWSMYMAAWQTFFAASAGSCWFHRLECGEVAKDAEDEIKKWEALSQ